jgi:hypothetical protein
MREAGRRVRALYTYKEIAMTGMKLLNVCHTYQLALLHALAWFGLGLEGMAAMDDDDYLRIPF